MRESYSFLRKLAIRIIYITSTKQRTYISTPTLKPNKPACPRKVAGPQLQGQKQEKKSCTYMICGIGRKRGSLAQSVSCLRQSGAVLFFGSAVTVTST